MASCRTGGIRRHRFYCQARALLVEGVSLVPTKFLRVSAKCFLAKVQRVGLDGARRWPEMRHNETELDCEFVRRFLVLQSSDSTIASRRWVPAVFALRAAFQ